MSGLSLGLGLGLGAHRKVAQGGGGGMPDWEMIFAGAPTYYYIGWKDMPAEGDLQDLINDGFVDGELDGVTATFNPTYVAFTGITADNTIRIKKTADITYLLLRNYINWTYSGAMPADLTYLSLYGNSIKWTWDGALPAGLTYLYFWGSSINWTWDGALPADLTTLYLGSSSINWTWDGAMPADLTYLSLYGNSINWTGSEIGNTEAPKPNMTDVSLLNFISPTETKMTPAQFSGIINSLAYNVGTLPATVTINELPNMTYNGVNAVDWGKMVGDSFIPSELAIALKIVVIDKGAVINLSAAGLTMPTETGDGVGFPAGFGDWWRIEE